MAKELTPKENIAAITPYLESNGWVAEGSAKAITYTKGDRSIHWWTDGDKELQVISYLDLEYDYYDVADLFQEDPIIKFFIEF